MQVAEGSFGSNLSSQLAAEQVSLAINALVTHDSSDVGNVVTAESVANSGEDLEIVLTAGVNDAGSASTNNLSLMRMVTQPGAAVDTFTGEDGMVSVLIGGNIISTINVSGITLTEVALRVSAAFSGDSRYTSSTTGTQVSVVATFLGQADRPSLDIVPGVLSNGTPATLAGVETVINNGENVTVTGETTQLTATIGDTSMTVDLTSGASAIDAANQLVGLINMFQLYSAIVSSGSTVTASSIRAEVTADLTVTVSRAGTGGTTMVARTQVQDGVDPSVDFSTTVWTYYTINQEVRVDDDTTAMMPDNTITIPRGLVVDLSLIHI